MNTNYTDVTVLVDRSGSMASIKQETLAGLNSFISEQKKTPDEIKLEGRRITFSLDEVNNPIICKLTLIQFASGVYIKTVDAKDICEVNPILSNEYNPNGGTPLIYSFCRAIDETGTRLGTLSEADRPGRVIFLTITDGEETAFNVPKQTLKDKIQHQSEVYKWQFIYQGANQDAIAEAAEIGISAGNALTYAATDMGTTMSFHSAAHLVSSKRYSCSVQDMDSMSYTVEDRSAQTKELGHSITNADPNIVTSQTTKS